MPHVQPKKLYTPGIPPIFLIFVFEWQNENKTKQKTTMNV